MSIRSFLRGSQKKEKIIKFIRRRLYAYSIRPSIFMKFRNEFIRAFYPSVVIDGWLIGFYKRRKQANNWGDDINVYFLEILLGKKIIPAKTLFFSRHRKKICAIGSVIPNFVEKKTTIWGAGALRDYVRIKSHPLKILAVRGPLTRNYFLEQGIECPAIYGDPALLLPFVYPSTTKKIYKVGFIPHHQDYQESSFEAFQKMWMLSDDIILINMSNYRMWTDIIDLITKCDVVFSSSLHGLIVADAYNVPNVWCEFSYHLWIILNIMIIFYLLIEKKHFHSNITQRYLLIH